MAFTSGMSYGCQDADSALTFLILLLSGLKSLQVHLRITPDVQFLLELRTHVIVGDGTPEERLHTATFDEEVLSTDMVSCHPTIHAVESNADITTLVGHHQQRVVLVDLQLAFSSYLGFICSSFRHRHGQLVIGHHMTGGEQGLGMLQTELDVEECLALNFRQGELKVACLLGSNIEVIDTTLGERLRTVGGCHSMR